MFSRSQEEVAMLTDAEVVKFVAFKAGLGRLGLQECLAYLPEQNLIVSVGGDLLSPYPLSTLDKGLGMVVPWHCKNGASGES